MPKVSFHPAHGRSLSHPGAEPRLSATSPPSPKTEVETLRDTAYVASDRILAFIKFLDDRSASIQTLADQAP